MLKFARRRARSSEREPVRSVVMNSSLARPRASSAERAASSPAPAAASPVVAVASRVEARLASVQSTASPRPRPSMFEDSETDLPATSIRVTEAGGEVTVSQLAASLGRASLDPEAAPVPSLARKPQLFSPPPAPPRKPRVETLLQFQRQHGWKVELLDTSAESGYGTDTSDNNSLKSVNSATETDSASPPPLPKRKPRRRVQFDSYVLLIQSLKDRDLKGIVSTIFNVSSEALCTEDVIFHFHTAILRQDFEVFELLVRGGVEVNTFDHRGWSALHCAASLARLDMIKLLLQNGAAVLARTHHSSQTATQLLPLDNPAYPQCLAYMRCMEECLGTVNTRLVLAAASYRATRVDELSIARGERLTVLRRGDVNNEMWWWVASARGEEGYVLRDLLALNSRHS